MKKQDSRNIGTIGSWVSLFAIFVIVAVGVVFRIGGSEAETKFIATPSPSPSPTIDALALPQCRVDAVMLYMSEQGFADDDYVIGEDRVDWEAPAAREAGQAAFGDPITSREELAETFESSDSKIRAALQRIEEMFPSYAGDGVLFDPVNWEAVQVVGASQIPGNTGIVDGAVVDMGVRNNSKGDGGWIFIDPTTCTVPKAEVVPTIGFIRFGCTNPGDGLIPLPTPEETPKKNQSLDPAPRGSAPEGEGRNDEAGTGEFIPEENMERPAQPRPPAEEVDHPKGSTTEPTPEPIPEPEFEAPTPEDPANKCSPAPGESC